MENARAAEFGEVVPANLLELIPVAYDELRRIARGRLAGLGPGQTLAPTELVNEAMLRLLQRSEIKFHGREHLIRVAVRAMHNILVDRARRRASVKRGGLQERVALDEALPIAPPADEMLRFDEACESLRKRSEQHYEVVLLRFYANMTVEEIAEVYGWSVRTVERQWTFAKAVLRQALGPNYPRESRVHATQ